ncbi:hypothetical protein HN958_00295 [Candidatus Falkowbacteria bacterium]|jgi:hypothetical protein|nr:hypothetical protein [Candidatus Falkowbacteria bacterium]MBT7006928.1 hypothetical protein [Candidatus Falkowbacteria bacterium]
MIKKSAAFSDMETRLLANSNVITILNRLVQKFEKNPEYQKDILDRLVAHPYLEKSNERINKIKAVAKHFQEASDLIMSFKNDIEQNKLIQVLPESFTKTAELNFSKISKRPVSYFGIDNNWLLIKIARHPKGGMDDSSVQHWLYSEQLGKLYLSPYVYFPNEKNMKGVFVHTTKFSSDFGKTWQEEGANLQFSFENIIKKELGEKAYKEYKRIINLPEKEVVIMNIPPEIDDFCYDYTGSHLMSRLNNLNPFFSNSNDDSIPLVKQVTCIIKEKKQNDNCQEIRIDTIL